MFACMIWDNQFFPSTQVLGAFSHFLFKGDVDLFQIRVKARIFDGDGGLGGKQIERFQPVGCKCADSEIIFKVEDAAEFALVYQRQAQKRFGLIGADII